MDNITIGEVVTAIACITALWIFYDRIIKAVDDMFKKRLDPMNKDIEMLKDVTYQMLDHMATDNNTGGMKKALDDYNKYNRHN